jgi:putative ABC transport system permease protein
MSRIAEWRRRLWYLLNRRRLDEALARDMAAHREAMGDPQRFGSTLRLREDARDVWGWRWLDDVVYDLRFATRALWRNPGFTLVVIVTLALATGATTAIFSVVNGVLLRPLPFAEPDRLVQVFGRSWSEDRGGPPDPIDGPVASLELEQYIAQSTLFDGFAAFFVETAHLDGPAGPERVPAARVDLGVFRLLGVEPLAGRTFREGDPLDVVVISASLWRQRFNSDPSLPGRAVLLNGRVHTVLGVMPDGFQFPYGAASIFAGALPEARSAAWLPMEPLRATAASTLRRGRVSVLGRIRRGASVPAARAELATIGARVQAQSSNPRLRIGVRLTPLAEVVTGTVRRSLWMLFAAVGLVLATACANVANLLLARMTVRTREVVTRAALGAGRLRLIRQFLAESALLAFAGGLVGVVVARWGTSLLLALGASRIPRAHEIALDWRAFAFLLVVCLIAAVLFGLAPALTAARIDARSVTNDAGGRATMGRGYGRLRDALVVLEVALAFVLASGAALVMREVVRLQNLPTGMQTENVLTLHLTPRATAAEYEAIAARVATAPGVLSAGVTQLVPLQNWGWDAAFEVRDRPSVERRTTGLRYVTSGYFRALGIPILRGRGFTASDTAEAPRVVLVNEALVRRYLRGQDPIGVELDRGTIVGVVGDVLQAGLDRPSEPEIYYAVAQNVATRSDIGMSLVVRTAGRPEPLTDTIRGAVREAAPRLAIFNVRTMEEVRAESLWQLNLYRWLIGLFAALALVLATIGLYGVIAYNASSRMREFAVRLALGSAPGQLTVLVFIRGLRLAALGLAAGLAAALAVAPLLRHLAASLTGDALTYALVGLLLLIVAIVACAAPAIRVAGVNPVSALRHD